MNQRTIQLTEYETTEVTLHPDEARRLQTAAKGVLELGLPNKGNYPVTASNFVGTIVLGDKKILIRPKINLKNLFLMLEVGLNEKAWRQQAFAYEASADLLPAFAAFYARTLETTLARGLLHSYRSQQEKLATLRGQIHFKEIFKQPGMQLPMPCRFDDHTADILENRYLKAACRRCLNLMGIEPLERRRLLKQVAALEDVANVAVKAADMEQITFNRLNNHYQPALSLARLLLDNRSLTDRSGQRQASSFLVDMNRLFEDFITQRLQRALHNKLEVHAQARNHLDVGNRVTIRPDLVFYDTKSQQKPVYVADIKYKLTDDGQATNSDYYQLLAYTTALNLPEGMLIYCHNYKNKNRTAVNSIGRGNSSPASEIQVTHANKVLRTVAINLDGSPTQVASAVEQLALKIATQAQSQLQRL